MDSASVTLSPGRAVVVYDPALVTAEQLVLAVTTETPFGAQVLDVMDAPEGRSGGDEATDCLIWGLFCG